MPRSSGVKSFWTLRPVASLGKLNPSFRPWAEALLHVARRYSLSPHITSGFRSVEKQRYLYERYLRGEHPFPVAPPGKSMHNYGLAFDMISNNNPWLGRVWEHWGGRYGGKNDSVHFSAG